MTRTLRKTIFAVITLVIVAVAIEGFSAISYGLIKGQLVGWDSLQAERAVVRDSDGVQLLADVAIGPLQRYRVIHPYLGFVLEPSPRPELGNDFGFTGAPPPFWNERRADSPVVVAVLGGSVAQLMVDHAAPELRAEIAQSACFEGRQIQIVNLALPGVKQPQQLMTLNYFASLGATLDLVIGLDGFNEVVLPVAENEKQGVFPFYPRSWKFQVAALRDIPTMRNVGEIEFLRGLRKRVASAFSALPMRFSFSSHLLWKLLDGEISRSVSGKVIDLALAEGDTAQRGGGYLAQGPSKTYSSDRERYRDLVSVWSESIRLMQGISHQMGMEAFFFLQPNQRVEGSKPFAPGEREIALPERHSYDIPARRGYPELLRQGEELRDEGVPFYDLTMIYRDVPEAIYVDGCCHVNPRGSKIMAREIGRVIRARFEGGAPCPGLE